MVGQPDAAAGLEESVAGRVHGHGLHRQDDRPPRRAGGLHSRTIEMLDQRGITDRFLAQRQVAQVASFAWIPLDISDFPARHPDGLALWRNHLERILAGWVGELAMPVYRGVGVTGFAQDGAGVDVALSDGRSLWEEYLVGCDGGRSLIRKAAGITFPGVGHDDNQPPKSPRSSWPRSRSGVSPRRQGQPFRLEVGGWTGAGHGDRTAPRSHQ